MKKNWLTIVLASMYMLLIAHFAFSNLVRTVGPAMQLASRQAAQGCPQDSLGWMTKPVIVDEAGYPALPAPAKGFPWATQWTDENYCPNYSVVRTQTKNFYINMAYAFGVTVLAGASLALVRQRAKNRNPANSVNE